MNYEFEYTSGTHAGLLDEETLEEIWDHLELDYTPAIKSPVFNSRIISLFEKVNGIAPVDTYLGDHQILRFLNFTNPYYPPNQSVLDWHIVRTRNWIKERLPPLCIPIAEFPHGNYLCMDFTRSEDPDFSFWFHEDTTLTLIASGLNSFYDCLTKKG